MISYDDLRIVNSKLVELNYEKKANIALRKIIANDSIIIKDYTDLTNRLNKDCKKAIKQRNVTIGIGSFVIALAAVLLIIK